MDGFDVLELDHVTVTSPAELESEVIQWYEQVLGLERVDKLEGDGEKGAWFSLGRGQLHLSLDPHNPPRKAHFAVAVRDFEGVVEHLRGHGCHIEQATEIPGRHRFFTRDPAGNRIELFALDGGAT
ncbi:MAG: VOC family protein [Actinobacteria bacterium]|nr:VOC family protein [Actinomycetota bacterium]